MKPFLRWWGIFTLSMVAFFTCRSYGFTDFCIQEDASYICITVFWLYILQSILCCRATYQYCAGVDLTTTKKQLDLGWFVSELCLNLGLLGTLIGFVMMLSGFRTLSIDDPSTSQALLTQLGKSMATALLTTVTGLVCGIALKFQYFNLNSELSDV